MTAHRPIVYDPNETRSLIEGKAPEINWPDAMASLEVGASFGCECSPCIAYSSMKAVLDTGHFPDRMFHVAPIPNGAALLVRDR